MSLQSEIISSLIAIEPELGSATITFNTVAYSCTASVADTTLELEFGGFKNQRLLNVTLRLLDANGYTVFSGGEPVPQSIITYSVDGLQYRVMHVHRHPTGAFIRLLCESITRGA